MTDTITINLNIFERKFLMFVAYSDGERDIDHNGLSPQAIEALDKLEKKGAISKVQIIGTSKTFQYKLTNIGSNLVDLIRGNLSE